MGDYALCGIRADEARANRQDDGHFECSECGVDIDGSVYRVDGENRCRDCTSMCDICMEFLTDEYCAEMGPQVQGYLWFPGPKTSRCATCAWAELLAYLAGVKEVDLELYSKADIAAVMCGLKEAA